MSWPRESLVLVLLVLSAPWASADTITVNTKTDDNATNSLCSLREAVEYFNRGKPKAGYQGCKAPASDSAAIIELPADEEPYLISSGAINVRTDLTIKGEGRVEDSTTTIRVVGLHRAFVINFSPDYKPPRCFVESPVSCAPAGAPLLDTVTDSDTGPDDFLTTSRTPSLTGSIDRPSGHAVGRTYVIRLYDHPAEGDPVQIGVTEEDVLASGTAPIEWTVRVNRQLEDGVHFLSYTVQEINTNTRAELVAESSHSPQLTVAVYPISDRLGVTFSDLTLEGGCAAATASNCADDVDDSTTVINDPAVSAPGYDRYTLSFINTLMGTSGNGGVIFNNELLTLSNAMIKFGKAAGNGGALFLGAGGGTQIRDSEFRENTAASGAAIFASANTMVLERSLVTANTVSGSGSSDAVIDVQTTPSPTLAQGLLETSIVNSTISGNSGRALSLRDDMLVNASTIVLNAAGGIHFNGEDVAVYNSIVAGNLPQDCESVPGTAVMENSLVVAGAGCPTFANQVISNTPNTIDQLMATTDAEGRCNSEFGLLCPLADHGGQTFMHVPRVLIGYSQVSDSPIINKASVVVGGFDDSACPGYDQRNKTRVAYACDIGAVEMQSVASGSFTRSGGVIFFGDTHTQSLDDDLADEELLPITQCPAPVIDPVTLMANPPAWLADITKVIPGTYRSDVPGCPWLEVNAGRGVVTFNTDGSYSYRPTVNFHGFDRFDLRVMTTLSSLNSLQADKSRLVKAQVIVEPSTGITSSKVGGALDTWVVALLGVLGLGWRGRRRPS